ncbi:MAG: nucleoside hydrolase [Clostridia bacterium]|nr:nucleoside hydrolase [Clostridia bacterium]
MGYLYEIPDDKKIRVIVDTDAACEADDPFAIAQALMIKKFIIKGIFATHFGSVGSMKRSLDEINTILSLMGKTVPVFEGEDGALRDVRLRDLSPAAKFLIQEAMREDEHPLYVLCLGAITNVARAILECPHIKHKMKIIWIGGQEIGNDNAGFREFNSGNDIEAANFVIGCGADLTLVPNNVYGSVRISLSEIQRRIYPLGEIGKHLFENMVAYNMQPWAKWTPGESWTLGDNPAIGIALDESIGVYKYEEAPIFNPDTTWKYAEGRPKIRVCTRVDSRFILEDLIARLEIEYG